MTIEEKAKRFDDALERARKFSEHPLQEDSSCVVEYIFPELKESEDEMIRKAIINTIEDCSPILSPEVQKRMIAWLEKQASKPKWSDEDEHRLKDTIYFLDTAKTHYASTVVLDACIDWLKSIKQRVEEHQ